MLKSAVLAVAVAFVLLQGASPVHAGKTEELAAEAKTDTETVQAEAAPLVSLFEAIDTLWVPSSATDFVTVARYGRIKEDLDMAQTLIHQSTDLLEGYIAFRHKYERAQIIGVKPSEHNAAKKTQQERLDQLENDLMRAESTLSNATMTLASIDRNVTKGADPRIAATTEKIGQVRAGIEVWLRRFKPMMERRPFARYF